mmetsp:Transcript_14613/g.57366  ORF Transcript_14613/g.57366 Transcript_14613/m.57366 type:complete len:285 (-) Transcript_14613:95-949(-)
MNTFSGTASTVAVGGAVVVTVVGAAVAVTTAAGAVGFATARGGRLVQMASMTAWVSLRSTGLQNGCVRKRCSAPAVACRVRLRARKVGLSLASRAATMELLSSATHAVMLLSTADASERRGTTGSALRLWPMTSISRARTHCLSRCSTRARAIQYSGMATIMGFAHSSAVLSVMAASSSRAAAEVAMLLMWSLMSFWFLWSTGVLGRAVETLWSGVLGGAAMRLGVAHFFSAFHCSRSCLLAGVARLAVADESTTRGSVILVLTLGRAADCALAALTDLRKLSS